MYGSAKYAAALVLWMALVAGCFPAPAPAPPATATPSAPQGPQSPATPAPVPGTQTTLARIRAVDMEGRPLANMLPIAARQPNAFEKPLAQGALTDADGRGVVAIPQNEWMYVRAWDPAQRMFANNYYDVLPGSAAQTAEMEIMMAPGALLTMQLVTPEGSPAADQNVGIMMFHPTRGPWWPGEADSDAKGRVVFPSLPPGKYTVKLKTVGGLQIDLPEVVLPPGGKTDLGEVALQ